MSLYALGDLHLSFQTNKPMDTFGSVWKHHERKIEKYVNRLVKPEDTLVLTGDHSWGQKASGVPGGSGVYRAAARPQDPAAGKSRHVLGREEDGTAE